MFLSVNLCKWFFFLLISIWQSIMSHFRLKERPLKRTEVHYWVGCCLQEGDRIMTQLLVMLLILFCLEDFLACMLSWNKILTPIQNVALICINKLLIQKHEDSKWSKLERPFACVCTADTQRHYCCISSLCWKALVWFRTWVVMRTQWGHEGRGSYTSWSIKPTLSWKVIWQ